MNSLSRNVVGALGVLLAGVSPAALAENPLGLYVGAGVGAGQVDNNYNYYNPFGYGGGFHDHDAAWKVIAGLRPISIVGAELEYIDFGSATGDSGVYTGNYDYSVSAHPKATVLYGLGYLPLPLPFIDVYGKLGLAHLQTNNGYFTGLQCQTSPGNCAATLVRFDEQNTKFAYGVGVQAKFQDFAFRGEYERISSSFGDPDALMVSVTWTF